MFNQKGNEKIPTILREGCIAYRMIIHLTTQKCIEVWYAEVSFPKYKNYNLCIELPKVKATSFYKRQTNQ